MGSSSWSREGEGEGRRRVGGGEGEGSACCFVLFLLVSLSDCVLSGLGLTARRLRMRGMVVDGYVGNYWMI